MTFDQLALISGVSKGMLVQMEQGATNPSIGTLCRVANAFAVTLSQLIDIPSAAEARRVKLADAIELWKGKRGSSAKLLFGVEQQDLVEFWRWKLLAGHVHDAEPHPKGTKEIVFILSGELTVIMPNQEHRLGANNALLFDADVHHSYANKTLKQANFTMVVIEPTVPA